jgi:hypothetical protein
LEYNWTLSLPRELLKTLDEDGHGRLSKLKIKKPSGY